ncbi:hypothetical protein EYZ11_002019 [Aspergillus tanneri]|uniref:SWI5-dependent HO expression protein 3 n=1 Tax=Aspergillus tanneri TaxID=1220188 RepID=A0A4S3JU73_9EURO|nr:uncharacterized protein ATNIH1004_004362 [Aspergillus tanneri]KAA8648477.1 hypothetical protein ATNIH1004_004362 [Aspergillus tanneri]THC98511.1 hypothetical protein EYZ11_002019 [Aspergillus tanneri]
MVRFGRIKKTLKAEAENANVDALASGRPQRYPRVSLPHVETQLNMHRYNGLFEPDALEHLKEPTTMAISTGGSPGGELGTVPTRTMNAHSDFSCISADSSTLHSSTHSIGSPNPTNGGTSTTEWSSAVGHAATGKSGRVIHNLQEEIARLTRECSLYRSRAEETQRMNDAFKTQVQNMSERLRNLEQANETNLHSISRKDNKIEELRTEAQSEKDRRRRAEEETNKIRQLMDEARDDFNRKCAELQEVASHARTQYDVLAKAGQRERVDQQRKFKTIRDEFIALKGKHEEKNLQLQRLDTVMAQKNREIEVSRESFEKLFEDYESYKKAHDEGVRTMIEKGHQGDTRIEAALASLKETEEQMRWVIQVKKAIKDAE